MAKIPEIDKRYFLMATPSSDIGYIHDSDISKSCDICGEGSSYGQKQRLHLYIKDTYDDTSLACFNCGYKSNLYIYLRDNHPALFELYKKDKQGKAFNELKMVNIEKESSMDDFGADDIETDFMDSPVTQRLALPNLVDPISELQPLPPEVIEYINKRGLEPKAEWLYSPKGNKFKFNGKETYLSEYIVIPLIMEDKWYGFQAVGWKQKKFFVYLVTANESWKVWNWFNINKDEPVYIFESVYDAMSSGLENSIAQIGVSLHEDRLKELKQPIFCMDNQLVDEASQRESLKYADAGYKIFIWPEGSEKFKDTNDLRKINVPYERISKFIEANIFNGMEAILKLKMI